MSSAALDSRSHSAQSAETCSDPNSVVARAQHSIAELVGRHVNVRLELSPNAMPVAVPSAELERIVLGLCSEASRILGHGSGLLVETRGAKDPELSAATERAQEVRTRVIVRPEPHGRPPPRAGSGSYADLVFCKLERLLDQVGAELELVSRVGHEVALVVHLPSAPVATVSSTRLPIAVLQEATLILLVEDEPQVQAVTARILRAFGYAVVTAHDEHTALAQADQHGSEIGLVVSDLLLPGVSGKELVNRLRKPCERAAILYISGYSPEHVGPLADGACFLRKPFTAQELISMVRGLMPPVVP